MNDTKGSSNRKIDNRVGVLVRMPTELKLAIVAEVERQGTNMNDVCVEVVAKAFGEKYEPTDRHGNPGGEADKVLLRMEPKLKKKVQKFALKEETNTNDTIIRLLAEEFDVAVWIPEGRRPTPFGGGSRAARIARASRLAAAES